MRIVFDNSSLRQARGGSITAVVYFDLGASQFPELGWNDFVVVVLSWWLTAMRNLEQKALNQSELRFMDGPYRIVVQRESDTSALLQYIEERTDAKTVYTARENIPSLIRQLHQVGSAVVSVCKQAGMKSSDIKTLESLLAS